MTIELLHPEAIYRTGDAETDTGSIPGAAASGFHTKFLPAGAAPKIEVFIT